MGLDFAEWVKGESAHAPGWGHDVQVIGLDVSCINKLAWELRETLQQFLECSYIYFCHFALHNHVKCHFQHC